MFDMLLLTVNDGFSLADVVKAFTTQNTMWKLVKPITTCKTPVYGLTVVDHDEFNTYVQNNNLSCYFKDRRAWTGLLRKDVLDTWHQNQGVLIVTDNQNWQVIKNHYKDALAVYISPGRLASFHYWKYDVQACQKQIDKRIADLENDLANCCKPFDIVIKHVSISKTVEQLTQIV